MTEPVHATKKSNSHRRRNIFLAIFAIVAIAISGVLFFSGENLKGSLIGTLDSDVYQAVQLDTGEMYFGEVAQTSDEFITITNVFYFLEGDKTKLVKRGKEAHGPEDSLTINREHVLTSENLSEDSAVMRAIRKYQQTKN